MKKYMFRHYALLVGYLSENRKKFNFIANHYKDKNLRSKKAEYISNFELLVEKGEPDFILPRHEQSNYNYATHLLKTKGSSEVLYWLWCLVSGMI